MKLAYALFTMLSLAAVPGCGGAISSLTDKHCDCVGCSDTKRNDYSYQLEDAQKSADDKGCSDQFDDFVNCANDHYQCDGGRDDITGCSTEGDKLARCIGHNVF